MTYERSCYATASGCLQGVEFEAGVPTASSSSSSNDRLRWHTHKLHVYLMQ
jgi:hypothetical protein